MFEAYLALSISLFIILILILHKAWEMKRGCTFISKGIIPKTDMIIKGQIDLHSEIIVKRGKRGIKALSSMTKESAKNVFLVFAHYLHDKLTKIILKMKGKTLKRKGSVSFFLKRMEGYKEGKHVIVNSEDPIEKKVGDEMENVK